MYRGASTHDSAHKEQICTLHSGTIDHAPFLLARASRRGLSNLDSPLITRPGALASAVNSLLVHGALEPRAGNVRVSVLLLINYAAYRALRGGARHANNLPLFFEGQVGGILSWNIYI